MSSKTISIESLKKFIEINNISISAKTGRCSHIGIDSNDFIKLFQVFSESGNGAFEQYLLCQIINEDSKEEDFLKYLKILNKESEFNPSYLFNADEIKQNIEWVKYHLQRLERERNEAALKTGKRKPTYRRIYERYLSEKFDKNIHIHHIDHNRDNNCTSNLVAIPIELHTQYHSLERNFSASNDNKCLLIQITNKILQLKAEQDKKAQKLFFNI